MENVSIERAAVRLGGGGPVDGYLATYDHADDIEGRGYTEEDAIADLLEQLARLDPEQVQRPVTDGGRDPEKIVQNVAREIQWTAEEELRRFAITQMEESEIDELALDVREVAESALREEMLEDGEAIADGGLRAQTLETCPKCGYDPSGDDDEFRSGGGWAHDHDVTGGRWAETLRCPQCNEEVARDEKEPLADGGEERSDDERTEEAPSDIVSVTTPEYAHGEIQTEWFTGEVDDRSGVRFSVEVHQDGPDIALSAGTASAEQERRLYTYHALSPAKAERVGKALLEAADMAKAVDRAELDEQEEASDSLLRRLMGR